MISLKFFLKLRKYNKSSYEKNFIPIIGEWGAFCKSNAYNDVILIPQEYLNYLDNFFEEIISAIQDPNHGIENGKYTYEMWINILDLKMDYFRSMMIDMIRLKSKEKPVKLPIELGKKKPGVEIQALIRLSETESIYFKDTQTNLASQYNKSEIRIKDVITAFSNLTFIRQETKDQISKSQSSSQHDYHAELLWMTYSANAFLTELKKVVPLQDKPNVDLMDSNWVRHLSVYPRIEFVLSSACCETCQGYFKDLRHYLNEAKIYLPMVIYSGKPYNTSEVSKSQMHVVLFNETFLATEIYIKTTYNSNESRAKFDFFKPIQFNRAQACEKSVSKAVVYINVHQHPEYLNKLLIGLQNIFLDKKYMNPSDLAWLRAFLVRWPKRFYEGQNDLYAKVLVAIEQSCKKAAKLNTSSLDDLIKELNTQVFEWVNSSCDQHIDEIDELEDQDLSFNSVHA